MGGTSRGSSTQCHQKHEIVFERGPWAGSDRSVQAQNGAGKEGE